MKPVYSGPTAPANPEPMLAFRLLCEAYKFKKIDAKPDWEGIEINAPEELNHWLEPFGALGKEDIELVAGMMGSDAVKTKAKEVLEAVSGNGITLKSAVEAFLEEVSEPSDQS